MSDLEPVQGSEELEDGSPSASIVDPTRPVLPLEIVCDIIALLDQPELSACLRVDRTFNAVALPLLYRRVAIPSIPAGKDLYDVRDAHRPKRHGALRGPDPTELMGIKAYVENWPDYPKLIEHLVIPTHSPHDTACYPLILPSLESIHFLMHSRKQSLHYPPPPSPPQRAPWDPRADDDEPTKRCHLLRFLHADTLVVHRANLLFSRLTPIAHPPGVRRLVLLFPPERARAGAAVKFDSPSAGATGVLQYLETFAPEVDAQLVLHVPAGERWKPIPRPKDGDQDGVPQWLNRLVIGLASDTRHKRISIVNATAALDPAYPGALEEVMRLAEKVAASARAAPLRFLSLDEWEGFEEVF